MNISWAQASFLDRARTPQKFPDAGTFLQTHHIGAGRLGFDANRPGTAKAKVDGRALVLLIAGTAHAQYGMDGCGLGSIVFGNDNGTLKQVIAATLNGTGMQTFGITSGTSNCVSAGVVRDEREQAALAEVGKIIFFSCRWGNSRSTV